MHTRPRQALKDSQTWAWLKVKGNSTSIIIVYDYSMMRKSPGLKPRYPRWSHQQFQRSWLQEVREFAGTGWFPVTIFDSAPNRSFREVHKILSFAIGLTNACFRPLLALRIHSKYSGSQVVCEVHFEGGLACHKSGQRHVLLYICIVSSDLNHFYSFVLRLVYRVKHKQLNPSIAKTRYNDCIGTGNI
jgi:hypothetical protein